MKRNIVRRMLVSLSFAVVLAALLPTARGQSCSLARAAGTYGFSDSGTVVGIGPRAAAGILTLDAAGNTNGKVTASLNGSITDSTVSGTYTVNPDCTGAIAFDEFDQSGDKVLTATANLVWDDNMREIRAIFTSAVLPDGTPLATVITVDAKKLVP